MATRLTLIVAAALLWLLPRQGFAAEDEEGRGYLNRPPVFINSEYNFPLVAMGVETPPPRKIIPAVDFVSLESDGFRSGGAEVQPGLKVEYDTVFVGGLYGISRDWAGTLIVPWQKVRVGGAIGGLPASGSIEGIGGVILGGKRRLWSSGTGEGLTFTGMLQLPTGPNRAGFDQSNVATNAYFTGYPRRMPLSWQPSSGTWNGYLGLAYGRSGSRISYVTIAATKLHTPDDEDVKIGDIFVLSGNATYGVSKRLALSLGLTLWSQAHDSHPQAPPPGIGQPLLAGTTQHGTTLFLDPSFRFIAFRNVAIGLGFRIPVIKPDDGLVPDTRLDVIFYPGM